MQVTLNSWLNCSAALVELLIAKARSWEEERKKTFLYDEVRCTELNKKLKLKLKRG